MIYGSANELIRQFDRASFTERFKGHLAAHGVEVFDTDEGFAATTGQTTHYYDPQAHLLRRERSLETEPA